MLVLEVNCRQSVNFEYVHVKNNEAKQRSVL